jgi:hypothetical protein
LRPIYLNLRENKKSTIKKSSIFIDEIIKTAFKWDSEEIEKRTEALGKLAYCNVFKI